MIGGVICIFDIFVTIRNKKKFKSHDIIYVHTYFLFWL